MIDSLFNLYSHGLHVRVILLYQAQCQKHQLKVNTIQYVDPSNPPTQGWNH